MKIKSKTFRTLIICFILVFLFFGPAVFSIKKAQGSGPLTGPMDMAWGLYKFSTGQLQHELLGKLIVVPAKWLDASLNSTFLQNFTRAPVLNNLWGLTRDIANMFFILALLVAAFGTIFNIQKLKAGEMLPKIIIAALLINFSLVIGQVIIDVFNFLSMAILKAIGATSIRFGELAELAALQPSVGEKGFSDCLKNIGTCLGAYGIEALGLTIFGLFSMIALTFAAFFIFLRAPILWFMLIFAPIAWLTSIFPQTRKFYSSWWHHFLYWCYFLPIYLFFIYLGFTFISQGSATILANISNEKLGFGGMTLLALSKNVIAVLTLLGGFWVATKIGGLGATVTVGAMGGLWRGTGIPGAYRQVAAGVQREGIRGIGGAIKRERKEERLAGIVARPLGLRGVGIEAQRAKEKRVSEEVDKLNDDLMTGRKQEGQLEGIAGGKDDRAIAAKILIAEKGRIDQGQFIKDMGELDPKTLVGKKYMETVIKNANEDLRNTFPDLAAAKGKYQALGTKVNPASAAAVDHLKNKQEMFRFEDQSKIQSALKIYEEQKGKDAKERLEIEFRKNRADLMAYIDTEQDPLRNLVANPFSAEESNEIAENIKEKMTDMKNKMGNWNFLRDQNYAAYENPQFQKALKQLIEVKEEGAKTFETLKRQFINKGEDTKLTELMKVAGESPKQKIGFSP